MTMIGGKSAIVTGATRGIGLAIANALLDRGGRVFICATKADAVGAAVRQLEKKFPGRINGVSCDVRQRKQVSAMVREAAKTMGAVDILINNAGIGIFGPVERMSPDDWDAVIGTNLSGVFYCCREVLPLMRARGGGYIINVGSLAGKNAFPGGAAYNASKFGLVGFSEALMQEVRYEHIRVSYLMPGSVDTEFGRSAGAGDSAAWKLAPGDVAEVVVNLLETDPRALSSRVELRPSEPRK